jgi:DNA-binding transcriptional LysR family regulator
MASYVGLDPAKDISWVTHPLAEVMRLLATGKIDAFLGFAPDPQELRAKKIGRVVVNSSVDRTHDLAQVQAVHPSLHPGDVLMADRGLCAYAHLALLAQAGMHAVPRVGARQLVDFTPGRSFIRPSVRRFTVSTTSPSCTACAGGSKLRGRISRPPCRWRCCPAKRC